MFFPLYVAAKLGLNSQSSFLSVLSTGFTSMQQHTLLSLICQGVKEQVKEKLYYYSEKIWKLLHNNLILQSSARIIRHISLKGCRHLLNNSPFKNNPHMTAYIKNTVSHSKNTDLRLWV